jgi:hypothetical protein
VDGIVVQGKISVAPTLSCALTPFRVGRRACLDRSAQRLMSGY